MVPVFTALFISVLGLREYAHNILVYIGTYFLLTAVTDTLSYAHMYLVAQKVRLWMSSTGLQSRKELLEGVK